MGGDPTYSGNPIGGEGVGDYGQSFQPFLRLAIAGLHSGCFDRHLDEKGTPLSITYSQWVAGANPLSTIRVTDTV